MGFFNDILNYFRNKKKNGVSAQERADQFYGNMGKSEAQKQAESQQVNAKYSDWQDRAKQAGYSQQDIQMAQKKYNEANYRQKAQTGIGLNDDRGRVIGFFEDAADPYSYLRNDSSTAKNTADVIRGGLEDFADKMESGFINTQKQSMNELASTIDAIDPKANAKLKLQNSSQYKHLEAKQQADEYNNLGTAADSKYEKFVGDLATGIGGNAMGMILGGAGSVVSPALGELASLGTAAISSAGDSTEQAYQRLKELYPDMPETELRRRAWLRGAVGGANEVWTEKVNPLSDYIPGVGKTLGLKDILGEGFEEMEGAVAEPLEDYLLLGDKEALKQYGDVNDYWLNNVGYQGLMGSANAIAMNPVGTVQGLNNDIEYQTAMRTGKGRFDNLEDVRTINKNLEDAEVFARANNDQQTIDNARKNKIDRLTAVDPNISFITKDKFNGSSLQQYNAKEANTQIAKESAKFYGFDSKLADTYAKLANKAGVGLTFTADGNSNYNSQTGVITINVSDKSADVLNTLMAHELTHATQGTGDYDKLANALENLSADGYIDESDYGDLDDVERTAVRAQLALGDEEALNQLAGDDISTAKFMLANIKDFIKGTGKSEASELRKAEYRLQEAINNHERAQVAGVYNAQEDGKRIFSKRDFAKIEDELRELKVSGDEIRNVIAKLKNGEAIDAEEVMGYSDADIGEGTKFADEDALTKAISDVVNQKTESEQLDDVEIPDGIAGDMEQILGNIGLIKDENTAEDTTKFAETYAKEFMLDHHAVTTYIVQKTREYYKEGKINDFEKRMVLDQLSDLNEKYFPTEPMEQRLAKLAKQEKERKARAKAKSAKKTVNIDKETVKTVLKAGGMFEKHPNDKELIADQIKLSTEAFNRVNQERLDLYKERYEERKANLSAEEQAQAEAALAKIQKAYDEAIAPMQEEAKPVEQKPTETVKSLADLKIEHNRASAISSANRLITGGVSLTSDEDSTGAKFVDAIAKANMDYLMGKGDRNYIVDNPFNPTRKLSKQFVNDILNTLDVKPMTEAEREAQNNADAEARAKSKAESEARKAAEAEERAKAKAEERAKKAAEAAEKAKAKEAERQKKAEEKAIRDIEKHPAYYKHNVSGKNNRTVKDEGLFLFDPKTGAIGNTVLEYVNGIYAEGDVRGNDELIQKAYDIAQNGAESADLKGRTVDLGVSDFFGKTSQKYADGKRANKLAETKNNIKDAEWNLHDASANFAKTAKKDGTSVENIVKIQSAFMQNYDKLETTNGRGTISAEDLTIELEDFYDTVKTKQKELGKDSIDDEVISEAVKESVIEEEPAKPAPVKTPKQSLEEKNLNDFNKAGLAEKKAPAKAPASTVDEMLNLMNGGTQAKATVEQDAQAKEFHDRATELYRLKKEQNGGRSLGFKPSDMVRKLDRRFKNLSAEDKATMLDEINKQIAEIQTPAETTEQVAPQKAAEEAEPVAEAPKADTKPVEPVKAEPAVEEYQKTVEPKTEETAVNKTLSEEDQQAIFNEVAEEQGEQAEAIVEDTEEDSGLSEEDQQAILAEIAEEQGEQAGAKTVKTESAMEENTAPAEEPINDYAKKLVDDFGISGRNANRLVKAWSNGRQADAGLINDVFAEDLKGGKSRKESKELWRKFDAELKELKPQYVAEMKARAKAEARKAREQENSKKITESYKKNKDTASKAKNKKASKNQTEGANNQLKSDTAEAIIKEEPKASENVKAIKEEVEKKVEATKPINPEATMTSKSIEDAQEAKAQEGEQAKEIEQVAENHEAHKHVHEFNDHQNKVIKGFKDILDGKVEVDSGTLKRLKELFSNGSNDIRHRVIHNDDAIVSSDIRIDSLGLENAVDKFMSFEDEDAKGNSIVKDGGFTTNDMVDAENLLSRVMEGTRLAHEAMNAATDKETKAKLKGTYDSALALEEDVRRVAYKMRSRAGYSLYASQLFAEMSGKDRVDSIENWVKDLNNRYYNNTRAGAKWKETHGNEDIIDLRNIKDADGNVLIDLYHNETDAKKQQEILTELEKKVANTIPPTMHEMATSWRYLMMLSNPATHVRNIAGNALMQGMVEGKNWNASLVEKYLKRKHKAVVFDKSTPRNAMIWNTADNLFRKKPNGNYENIINDLVANAPSRGKKAYYRNAGASGAFLKYLTNTESSGFAIANKGVQSRIGDTLGQILSDKLDKQGVKYDADTGEFTLNNEKVDIKSFISTKDVSDAYNTALNHYITVDKIHHDGARVSRFNSDDKKLLDTTTKLFNQLEEGRSQALGTERGDKYRYNSDYNEYRQAFGTSNNILLKTLNTWNNINNKALSKEDVWSSRGRFARALAGTVKAQGYELTENDGKFILSKNGKSLTEAQTDSILAGMIKYADKEAQESTYHDENRLANNINRMRNTNKATKFLLDTLMPFTKTPMNILDRAIEYSPAGLIKNLHNATANLNSGKIDADAWVEGVSKGLAGTELLILGAALRSMGVLSGKDDDDDDKKKKYKQDIFGYQDYALHIRDKYYSLGWAAPTSTSVLMGAEVFDLLAEAMAGNKSTDADDVMSELLGDFGTLIDPILQNTYMSSVADAIKSFTKNGELDVPSVGQTLVKDYAAQFVPAVGRTFTKIADPVARSTYGENTIDTIRRNAIYGFGVIPSLSELENGKYEPISAKYLEPQLNAVGEEKKIYGGNALGRGLYAGFSPTTITQDKHTAEDETVLKLFDETTTGLSSQQSYFTEGNDRYDLNLREKTAFNKTLQSKFNQYTKKMLKSPLYADNSDNSDYVKNIEQKLYNYAKKEAEEEYFNSMGQDGSWVYTDSQMALKELGGKVTPHDWFAMQSIDGINGIKNSRGVLVANQASKVDMGNGKTLLDYVREQVDNGKMTYDEANSKYHINKKVLEMSDEELQDAIQYIAENSTAEDITKAMQGETARGGNSKTIGDASGDSDYSSGGRSGSRKRSGRRSRSSAGSTVKSMASSSKDAKEVADNIADFIKTVLDGEVKANKQDMKDLESAVASIKKAHSSTYSELVSEHSKIIKELQKQIRA